MLSSVQIYRFSPDTFEYLPTEHPVFARIDPHAQHLAIMTAVNDAQNSQSIDELTPVLVPAHSQVIKPLEPKDGYAIVASIDEYNKPIGWHYQEDYREQVIYDIADHTHSKKVMDLGPVPDGWTLKKPIDYSIWNQNQGHWEYSKELEKPDKIIVVRAKRDRLLVKATHEIYRLEDNRKRSKSWRKYRQALRDIPQQDGFPFLINWPKAPGDFSGQ